MVRRFDCFVSLWICLVNCLVFFFGTFLRLFLDNFFLGTDQGSIHIDTGISQALKGADKISMTKNIFGEGQVKMTLATEKSIAIKWNTTFGRDMAILSSSLGISGLRKKIFPKCVFYLNQGYQSFKDNKKSFTATILYSAR